MKSESAREPEVQPDHVGDSPTTAGEIRNRTQRTIKSPHSGNTYLIRDYAPVDALRLQRLPKILKDPEEAKKPEDEQDPDAEEKTDPEELTEEDEILNRLKFSEAVVEACCLSPKFTCDKDEVSDDVLHVTEISGDIYWLTEEIVKNWADAFTGKLDGSLEKDSAEKNS